MDRLVLIGTFIKPDSATALLRTASGKIRAVSKGDRIGGAQVAGIEEGRVAIARDQRTIMLKLRPEMKRT